MAVAGYSGTPLLKKLGIKNDMRILLIHEPPDYFALHETSITQQLCKIEELPDMVHLFVVKKIIFEKEMKKLIPLIKQNPNIIIWISWLKKSSKQETDNTEDTIRNYALSNNLVDIKGCAVSDCWSGLKLVVPVAKRK